MTDWIEKAKEMGFDEAAPLNTSMLEAKPAVRDMCAIDMCYAYNRNWTCPPACGTLDECQQRMGSYKNGILLQTVGRMSKYIDTKVYRETEERHMEQFYAFAEVIRREYPEALLLGAGGCRICKQCAYPAPCLFPEKACSSMEAYGLFVTQVCRDNSVPYYHGPKTITYTACVLF